MMKTQLLFIITLLFFSCKGTSQESISLVGEKTKLIDGILLDNNLLFNKEDISLKKYEYNGSFLEDISLDDLMDKNYRDKFIEYLTNNQHDEFNSTLVTQLLIIRIYQLEDRKAFKILLDLSKNENISYNGIELYDMILTRILIEKSHFFIEQCYENQDIEFLKYVASSFNQYFLDNDFFELNMGYVNSNGGELLLNPEIENRFGTNFKEIIKTLPKVEVIFSPSLYTGWKNKTIFFTDVSSIFGKQATQNMSTGASVYYKLYVLPEIDKYLLLKKRIEFSKNYIQDPDGFTNLRKEKNTTSEVLQKIKSGEQIEVLNNTGDWFLVKTKGGKQGYVHRSGIKNN